MAFSPGDPGHVTEHNNIIGFRRAGAHLDAQRLTSVAAQHHESAATMTLDTLGVDFGAALGVTRCRGAVIAPNGDLWVIPRNLGLFVIVHPDGTVEEVSGGLTEAEHLELNISGGTLGPDGLIYCPPRDSNYVLIIDPRTRTVTKETYGLDLSDSAIVGTQDKYTGIVLGVDGKLYCAPTSACQVLVIDPYTQTAEFTDYGTTLASGTRKWLGAVLAPNGKIYCPPYQHGFMLVIDPCAGTLELIDFGLDFSGIAKWSGGAVGADGRLYFTPRQATGVLIVDCWSHTAEIKDYGLTMTLGDNKWTRMVNGADGKLYCSPATAVGYNVLVIDPIADSAVTTDFGVSLSGSELWIGGALSPSGVIYFTPDQASNFMLIDTATTAPAPDRELVLSPMLNKSP